MIRPIKINNPPPLPDDVVEQVFCLIGQLSDAFFEAYYEQLMAEYQAYQEHLHSDPPDPNSDHLGFEDDIPF